MTLPLPTVWRHAVAQLVAVFTSWMILTYAAIDVTQRGHSAMLAGMLGAIPAFVFCVLMPRGSSIRRAFGAGWTYRLGLMLNVAVALGFAISDNVWWWLVVSALGGVKGSLLYAYTDALFANNAPPERLGTHIARYQTSIAVALLAAPAVPVVFGLSFDQTVWVAVAFSLIAFGPLIGVPVHLLDQQRDPDRPLGYLQAVRIAPVLMGAAALGGLFEIGLNMMTPVHALHVGMTPANAMLLVTLIAVGSLLVQLPTGWLADRVSPHALYIGSSVLMLASGVVLLFTFAVPWLLWPLALLWGAVGGSLYTVLAIDIGKRFSHLTTGLMGTTAGAYWAASTIGGGAGGAATDLSPGYGLASVLISLSAVMLAMFVWGWRRDVRKSTADRAAATNARTLPNGGVA